MMDLKRTTQPRTKLLCILFLLSLLFVGSAKPGNAASLSFSVDGTNAATGTSLVGWANFVLDSQTNTLTVQVINGSGNAVQTTDILGAIFFTNTNGSSILTPTGASKGPNSYVRNPPATYSIGQQWQFKSGIAGPSGSNSGIGSNSFGGLFSSGNFAANGQSVSGINYGIANGIDQNATAGVKNAVLIQNEVDFSFTVSNGFSLDSIRDVYFQFGTTTSGPRLFANLSVPEPGSIALLMTMGSSGLLFGFRQRRLRKRA